MPSDKFIGRVLDSRYRVEELIAQGGMATVYRATDTKLTRSVAIKVLSSKLVSDPGFVERFTHEARAAASLTHPNVVAVHDQGVAQGYPYLVMEFVPGRTIREALSKSGPFTPAHALEIMKAVLAGLASAHAAGFVHRDIKPENVLITHTGLVKVTDFGLARVIDDSPVGDATGQVLLGTMAYLSPEQVHQTAIDGRSDVYSAGILLFEMLTGRVPYTGNSPLDVAYQHVNQDVPAPSTYQPDVPPAVDHLVLAATRRNPNDRIQSAQAFLDGVGRATVAVPAVESITDALLLEDTLVLDSTVRGSHRATEDMPAIPSPRLTNRTHSQSRSRQRTETNVAGATQNKDNATQDAGRALPSSAAKDKKQSARSRKAKAKASQEKKLPVNVPARQSNSGVPARRFAEKRSKRGPLITITFLGLAAIAIGWFFFTGKYVAMPDVVNQSQSVAVTSLEKVGLTARITEDFSEDIQVGIVLRTSPIANTKARKGLPVTVVVSKGPERYLIPTDVNGKDIGIVQSQLESLNLTVAGTRQEYDDKIAEGKVISTDPPSGESVKRGTAVTIIVSRGPAPVDVPGILNMNIKQATAALAKVGLEIVVTSQVFDDSAVGTVITADPVPGKTVPKGTKIKVIISKGPPLIDVPNVVGLGVAAATKKLEDAGFKVKTENQLTVVILNKVYSQSVSGGSSAPKGSTITLKLV
ncbi:unannotated protein [freshwater metagenome]|uniref:Unannotated protein n=1 Tax=freshwater metagenome TaxID=449393 RepID=A0A6J5Z5Z5_9ZZZZ